MDEKGYIHVYTGNGKGKTTAAFGVALRTLCVGKKVFVGQFVKSMKYNETKVDKHFDTIEIRQFGRGCFIKREATQEDVEKAQDGLAICKDILSSGKFDLVILDELNIALHYSLLSINDVIETLNQKHPKTEVIITGRYAPQAIIEIADLVTEMTEVKHYYHKGVQSRSGIDK